MVNITGIGGQYHRNIHAEEAPVVAEAPVAEETPAEEEKAE
jgi:hypothetical protein